LVQVHPEEHWKSRSYEKSQLLFFSLWNSREIPFEKVMPWKSMGCSANCKRFQNNCSRHKFLFIMPDIKSLHYTSPNFHLAMNALSSAASLIVWTVS